MKFYLVVFFSLKLLVLEVMAQLNLNDGMIAYYNFNNNSEDLCHKHSVVFSNNSFTYDKRNLPQSSAYFNGSQYIEIADADDLTFDQNMFTFSCWVKCDDTSKIGSIFSKRNPWGNFEYSLDNGMNKEFWVFDHWTNGGKNAVYGSDPFKSKIKLNQGEWQHIVFVSNNTELSSYLNGVKSAGVDLKNSGMNFENTTSNFCIGKGGVFAKDYYFTGSIDNLRIYNRALSELEIKELYRLESKDAATEIQVLRNQGQIWINVFDVKLPVTLFLYNLLGEKILNFDCSANQLNCFSIDQYSLSSGIYILTDGKDIVTKFAILY